MRHALDKIAAIGAVIAAAASCCLPLFAVAGTALGLGVLAPYEGYMAYALQVFTVLSLVGTIMAYRQHRSLPPLILAIVSTALVFIAYYIHFKPLLIYLAVGGLLATAIWNFISSRRCASCNTDSVKPTL